MANSCALARERLAKYVGRLRQAATLEKGTTAIKAGFLGSVVTPTKAVLGNAISTGYRTLVEHPLRAGFDYVLSVGRAAGRGDFTLSPDKYRQVVFALDADGLGRFAQGFRSGARPFTDAVKASGKAFAAGSGRQRLRNAVVTFADELTTRLDAEQVNRTLDYREIQYTNPVVNAVVNGVMGVMEATDRPYWRASHDFSLYMQGKLLAAAEGLRGPQAKQRAADLFESPTDEMLFRAVTDANYATFKNRNALSRLASSVKMGAQRVAETAPTAPKGTARYGQEATKQAGGKAVSYLLETNLPFTGVPSSIAGQSFGLTPAGLVRLLTNRDPAVTSRILSDATAGAALMAIGYKMAKEGTLIGAAPTASGERSQFDTEGKQAYSVKTGDRWFDLRFTAPISAPLWAGAALANVQAKEPESSVADQAIATAGSTAKMLTEQTYLQNVKRLIEALGDPENKATSLAASQVPVPALVGQVARATDPTERRGEGTLGRIATRLPGVSRTQPEVVDALGRTQTRDVGERVATLVSPGQVRATTENAVTREFRRLGLNLTQPKRVNTVRGERLERTAEEQVEYLQELGAAKMQRFTELLASPRYQALGDEAKAELLEREQDRLEREARSRFILRKLRQRRADGRD